MKRLHKVARFVTATTCMGVLVVSLNLLGGGRARAQGSYSEELSIPANEAVLDVIIVPPAHGQIYNDNGVLGGTQPTEATPFNTYLKSIERGIDDWRRAIDQLGAPWLSSAVVFNKYVAGRDSIPPGVLADPEIVIFNEESKGLILGLTLVSRPTCTIYNSSWLIKYFSPEDFYNVSAHEFGHCLGISHMVDDKPPDDLMAPTYKQPIGAQKNVLQCISTLNMRSVEASFRFLTGATPPRSGDVVSIPISDYYRTQCGTLAEPGPEVTPSPSSSNSPDSGSPEGSTASESPSPSQAPSSEPPPADDESEVAHTRWLGVKLSKHLKIAGLLAAEDGEGSACTASIEVSIERRGPRGWQKVAGALTDEEGLFEKRLPDRPGRYRVQVPDQPRAGVTCLAAISRVVRHRH